MSRLTTWIEKQFEGHPKSLPFNLRNYKRTGKPKNHDDWFIPIGKLIPRSWNATGPRCGKGNPGYEAWPPRLIEGYDVTRWENAGATSILFFPGLMKEHVNASSLYGKSYGCIETNSSNPNFRQAGIIKIDWSEAAVEDVPVFDDQKNPVLDPWGQMTYRTVVTPNIYSPSALQKFSGGNGFLKMEPGYTCHWKMITKRYWPWENGPLKPDKEDSVWFYRIGKRPDHLDVYYNKSPIFTIGRRWE